MAPAYQGRITRVKIKKDVRGLGASCSLTAKRSFMAPSIHVLLPGATVAGI